MTTQTERAVLVRASGVLLWRRRGQELQVALVHRPRYDDWSWPKGKLEQGEEWAVAAVRETFEETGLQVRLGAPLPTSWYGLGTKDGRAQLKQVRYWAGTVRGGKGTLEHEIDQVEWLPVGKARDRLTYRRDREQLDALVDAQADGTLDTWTLLLVRHAHAVGRGSWSGPDLERPLSAAGTRRSNRVVPLLRAYQPDRLISSPALRCTQTLAPYAAASGLDLVLRRGLSEEGFAESPDKAGKALGKVLARGAGTALCTHGPVLPSILTALSSRAPAGREQAQLARLSSAGLDKGEVLAVHLADTGERATVVHVERHRPAV